MSFTCFMLVLMAVAMLFGFMTSCSDECHISKLKAGCFREWVKIYYQNNGDANNAVKKAEHTWKSMEWGL